PGPGGRTVAQSPGRSRGGVSWARRVLRRRSADPAGRFLGPTAAATARARSCGGGQRPSRRLRRMGGHARDDAEPAPDLAARRRAYPVRDAAALAPANRVRVLVSRHPAGPLVDGVVRVGPARPRVVARAPRSPARARRPAAAAHVAPPGRVGGARPLLGHVCAGAVPPLTVSGGGGSV